MIKRLLSLFIFISLTQLTYAKPTKPDHCPTLSDLSTSAWDAIESGSGNENVFWGWKLNQKLNTNVEWDALIGPIKANDKEDAKQKLSEAIASLNLMGGPVFEGNHYMCGYINTKYDFVAIVMSPSEERETSKVLSHFSYFSRLGK